MWHRSCPLIKKVLAGHILSCQYKEKYIFTVIMTYTCMLTIWFSTTSMWSCCRHHHCFGVHAWHTFYSTISLSFLSPTVPATRCSYMSLSLSLPWVHPPFPRFKAGCLMERTCAPTWTCIHEPLSHCKSWVNSILGTYCWSHNICKALQITYV